MKIRKCIGEPLDEREFAIMNLLCAGHRIKSVALQLGKTEQSIHYSIRVIMEKLEAKTLCQAAFLFTNKHIHNEQ